MKKNIAVILSIISIGIILSFYKLSILESRINKEKQFCIKDIKGNKEELNNINLIRNQQCVGFWQSNYEKVYTLDKNNIKEEKIWGEDYNNPFRKEDKAFYRMMQKGAGFSNKNFFEDELVRFAIKFDKSKGYKSNSKRIIACFRDKNNNKLKSFTSTLNENIEYNYGVYHKDGVFKVLLGNLFDKDDLIIAKVDFENEKIEVEKKLNIKDIVGKNEQFYIKPVYMDRFKRKPSGNTIRNNWVIEIVKERRDKNEEDCEDKIVQINPNDVTYKINKSTKLEQEKLMYKNTYFDRNNLYNINAYKNKILIDRLNGNKNERFQVDNKFIKGINLESLECKIIDNKVYFLYTTMDKRKEKPEFDYELVNKPIEQRIFIVDLKNSDILYEGNIENAGGNVSFEI